MAISRRTRSSNAGQDGRRTRGRYNVTALPAEWDQIRELAKRLSYVGGEGNVPDTILRCFRIIRELEQLGVVEVTEGCWPRLAVVRSRIAPEPDATAEGG